MHLMQFIQTCGDIKVEEFLHGKRIYYFDLNQAEAKHLQFNWIRDCWIPWLHSSCIMDKVLYGSSRIPSHETNVYQDNKSSILLDKNMNSSSIKKTNHINISLFSITERIGKKELNTEWCHTNDIIGYFMTKLMQGNLFNNFRDLIMGVISIIKDI